MERSRSRTIVVPRLSPVTGRLGRRSRHHRTGRRANLRASSRQSGLRKSQLHGAEQAPGVVDHLATDDGGGEGQVVVEHDHVGVGTR